MSTESNEDLVFDYRTLRLIIGALAAAFPATVILLTGKVTTSISASYHEEANRDVFVGFLFILGALLIAYKGHDQNKPKTPTDSLWAQTVNWVLVYQERIVSTIGGLAAIFTALYPTKCGDCLMDMRSVIHLIGAGILFMTVVYFSLVAFLRRVNKRLVEDNSGFMGLVVPIESRWLPHIPTFLNIVRQISNDYDRNDFGQIARAMVNRDDNIDDKAQFVTTLADVEKKKPNKLSFMLSAYGKKITRGFVYLVCGPMIVIVLVIYLILAITMPDWVENSTITFTIETLALGFFGIAWMTASKLEYLKQIMEWWKGRPEATPATPQADLA